MGAARPIIIEKSAIAAAASGKAGGFLAREWGSGPTIQLHQSSYDLHAELAKTLHISSYRAIPTLSVNGNRKGIVGATWLDGRASSSPMEGATAQVTPLELTSKLIEAAKSKGADVLFETVEGLLIERGEVKGVRLKGRDPLPADIVIIAMGPWSAPLIEDNFRIPLPMQGIKSTSILYTNLDEIRTEPYACFCAEDRNGCHLELYPRTNGDLYICGCGGSDYVEVDRLREGGDCDSAEKILADPDRVAAATASFQDMSSIGSRHVPSIKQVDVYNKASLVLKLNLGCLTLKKFKCRLVCALVRLMHYLLWAKYPASKEHTFPQHIIAGASYGHLHLAKPLRN